MSSEKITLEELVESIPMHPGITYESCGRNKDKEKNFPTLFLPVIDVDENSCGIFKIRNKIAYLPFALSYLESDIEKQYSLTTKGDLIEVEKNSVHFVLPLTKIDDVYEAIGNYENSEFIPLKGSPFPVLGLNGEEKIPLILIMKLGSSFLERTIYLDQRGKIALTDQKLNYQLVVPLFDDFFTGNIHFLTDHLQPKEKSVSTKLTSHKKRRTPLIKTAKIDSDYSIASSKGVDLMDAKSIHQYLNRFIIGQEYAKKVASVAMSSYMAKIKAKSPLVPKNVLFIGPSGVGKTYIFKLLGEISSLPFIETKISGKSAAGYVGESIASVFLQVRKYTDHQYPKAIIFLDEIDKAAFNRALSGGFGPTQQDELNGYLEETNVTIEDTKDTLNTRDILFVAAGAFQGVGRGNSLLDIIKRRLGVGKQRIGFLNAQEKAKYEVDEGEILQKVIPEDLITYGFKPELIGRLPYRATLNPLSREEKIRILTEVENSPLEVNAIELTWKGYQLQIDPEVPGLIVDCCSKETGVRDLDNICTNLFTELKYDPQRYAQNKVITITPDLARKLIIKYTLQVNPATPSDNFL